MPCGLCETVRELVLLCSKYIRFWAYELAGAVFKTKDLKAFEVSEGIDSLWKALKTTERLWNGKL